MREHSIVRLRSLLEAKKMFKAKKRKATGPITHSVSHIFKRAQQKRLKPGRYFVHGVHIYVDDDRNAHLECEDCGMVFDSYFDFSSHRKNLHQKDTTA